MQLSDLKPAKEFAQQFGVSGIYAIINITNDKHYIGSAVNFSKRWGWHLKDLKGKRHRNAKLQNSWNNHWDFEFIFVKLEYCEKEQLLKREQWWIDNLKPEYNIAMVAGNSLGLKRSSETKEKQRQAKLGKKQTTSHIANRAIKLKGHKVTDAQKEALRKRSLGNKWGLGFKQTEEAKAKISKTHKGKPKSADHKIKISESLRKVAS